MISINRLWTQILCNGKIYPIKIGNSRTYAKAPQLKVTICGARSVIGQPLSLMLKQSPYIDVLALYDFQPTCGIGAELQHIDTKCKVIPHGSADGPNALKGAQVVVIIAGSSLTTRCDMHPAFDRNALVVKEAVLNASQYCPEALIAIASSPLEGMVPLAAEIMKLKGVYKRSRIFGVSTLNAIRANTFAAGTIKVEPECMVVPIIGGNTGDLIVPVLTEAKPFNEYTQEEIVSITNAVQTAQEKILKRQSNEAAVLSSSFAIARFVISLIKGLKGQPAVLECAFVRTDAHPGARYMNIPVLLGPNGINKDLGLPVMSSYEQCFLDNAMPVLNHFERRARDFLGLKRMVPCDPCDPDLNAPPCPEDHCEKMARSKLQR